MIHPCHILLRGFVLRLHPCLLFPLSACEPQGECYDTFSECSDSTGPATPRRLRGRSSSLDNQRVCPYQGCEQVCRSRQTLRNHIDVKHRHPGWVSECLVCGERLAYSTNNKNMITRHLRTSHQIYTEGQKYCRARPATAAQGEEPGEARASPPPALDMPPPVEWPVKREPGPGFMPVPDYAEQRSLLPDMPLRSAPVPIPAMPRATPMPIPRAAAPRESDMRMALSLPATLEGMLHMPMWMHVQEPPSSVAAWPDMAVSMPRMQLMPAFAAAPLTMSMPMAAHNSDVPADLEHVRPFFADNF